MADWDKLMNPAREALEALVAKGDEMADRIEALEAKLEKAVEALAAWKHYDESDEQDHVSLMLNYADAIEKTRTTLAELKGEK